MRLHTLASSFALALLACNADPKGDSGRSGAPTDPSPTGGTSPSTDVPTDSSETLTTPAPSLTCGLSAAPDLDPDPAVVHVELHADDLAWDPGTGLPVSDGLAFSGTVPGPLIVVDQGQTLRVDFVNDSDMANTIHWHGLRIPEDQDGVAQMMDPVEVGETFTYEFVVPDAGFYWYHPHMDTDMVLERGLYGAIWVRHPEEPPVDCLVPVVIDDLLVGADGSVASADMGGGMGGMGGGMMMPRLGDTMLANGRTDTVSVVPSGASTLFAIVNAANARYFELSLEGHALEVVGSDGGWLAAPEVVDALQVAPGERYLVRVVAGAPGDYAWITQIVSLGGMMADDPLTAPATVWTTRVVDPGVATTPLVLPAAEPMPDPGAALLHRYDLDESGGMGMEFTIDGETWPDVPGLLVTAFTPTRIDVRNNSSMRHPFHLHGQRFAITSGLTGPGSLGWKDTFDVPVGATVSFVTEADNPGDWMYHCHILEHAEGGMAGMLTVQ